MNRLRDLVEDGATWNEDQYIATISDKNGGFVVLSWYKHRGRTEGAWWVFGTECVPMTLTDAEKVLERVGK